METKKFTSKIDEDLEHWRTESPEQRAYMIVCLDVNDALDKANVHCMTKGTDEGIINMMSAVWLGKNSGGLVLGLLHALNHNDIIIKKLL